MEPDEILDGLALWDEHKPQSGDDWIAVARRSVEAEDYDPSVGSPLFQGLYHAVAALMEIERVFNEGWLPAIPGEGASLRLRQLHQLRDLISPASREEEQK